MRYYKDITKFVTNKKVFCGIDVHEKSWTVCMFCDGEVLEKKQILAKYEELKSLLKFYSSAREIEFVYEAGYSGFWLYRKLSGDGYKCMVTPPNLIPKSGSKVKTDKRDATQLASYLSAGLLKRVTVPPPEIESDRRLIRRRSQLVKKRNRSQNQIRSFLHLHGIRKPLAIKTHWSNAYLCWLESLEFTFDSDKFTLMQLLKNYHRIREDFIEINQYLRQLSQSKKYIEWYTRLTSLKGIGLITAMTFILEVFDFNRFVNAKHFSSYLGFTPSQHSSGDQVHLGHITRQGNSHLRRILVESAWTVIKHDPHLREKYHRIRNRGTNGKKAIVAVARSLAVRLRRCILDEIDYVIGVC
jgi:transposase